MQLVNMLMKLINYGFLFENVILINSTLYDLVDDLIMVNKKRKNALLVVIRITNFLKVRSELMGLTNALNAII